MQSLGLVPNDTMYCYLFSLAAHAADVRYAGDILTSALARKRLQPGKDSQRIAGSMHDLVRARRAARRVPLPLTWRRARSFTSPSRIAFMTWQLPR